MQQSVDSVAVMEGVLVFRKKGFTLVSQPFWASVYEDKKGLDWNTYIFHIILQLLAALVVINTLDVDLWIAKICINRSFINYMIK